MDIIYYNFAFIYAYNVIKCIMGLCGLYVKPVIMIKDLKKMIAMLALLWKF